MDGNGPEEAGTDGECDVDWKAAGSSAHAGIARFPISFVGGNHLQSAQDGLFDLLPRNAMTRSMREIAFVPIETAERDLLIHYTSVSHSV